MPAGSGAGLLACPVLPHPPAHFGKPASLHRACRRNGETVRSVIDCLIAATVIRASMLLHADADLDHLARRTALEIARP